MSPGRWCRARRHRAAKRENKTFGGVIVSTLTKHRTYSGYDLSYVSHTLRYVCPLRTSYCTRLRSIYLCAGNCTVSYVHSFQVQKTCLRINYFHFCHNHGVKRLWPLPWYVDWPIVCDDSHAMTRYHAINDKLDKNVEYVAPPTLL